MPNDTDEQREAQQFMDEKLAQVWGDDVAVPKVGVPGLWRLGGVHSISSDREETLEKVKRDISGRLFPAVKSTE